MSGMICKGCKKKRPYDLFPKSGWGKCMTCRTTQDRISRAKNV